MAKKNVKGAKKTVSCTYCGESIEISAKAMSVFCPHCHKRVVCEDYTIKSYHAVRNFATCGDIVIEKKGHVVAPIRAESLIVRGRVRGDVRARCVVEIGSTGILEGNVEAPRLVIHDGGKLVGGCRITRNGNASPRKPTAGQASDGPASRRAKAPAKPRTTPTPQSSADVRS